MKKLWETTPSALDPRVEAFMSSLAVDKALLSEDIQGSIAHAAMLGDRKILPGDRAADLVSTLRAMLEQASAGSLVVDEDAEDIPPFV